jgi:hypothetical protein
LAERVQFSALGEAVVVPITQVLDQVPPQDTCRVRIQPLEGTDHKSVQTTRISEIGRSGINDVVVELSIRIASREPRVGCNDLLDPFGARGVAGSVEVGWELHVPEERSRSFHREFTLGFASVDKEVDREDSLPVRGEIANVLERELGVGGDGILNAGEAELACDGEIVESSTIAVAEVDKLKCHTICHHVAAS